MTTETVTISHLGAQGDGIADGPEGPIYVGFTLPGETVTIDQQKNKGQLLSVEQPSPKRVEPPCSYFGPQGKSCGGCALQHMNMDAYYVWKRQLVVDALASRGIEADVLQTVECSPLGRRRAVFSAQSTRNGLLFGFNQAGTHNIVDIKHCTVLSPAITNRLDAFRSLANLLARSGKSFRLQVLATLTGLDVSIENMSQLSEKQRQQATALALQLGFARLSLGSETLVEAHKPIIRFSGVDVSPPPIGFVQASVEAQDRMVAIVAEHLSGLKRVADLFSGSGTFTFELARQSAVHAVEADGPAMAALDQAARHAKGLKPISVEKRDLYRRPLQPADLKKIDGVTFDPPRAGAQEQAEELAKSKVGKVAAVSCNPATLARDLRILLDGGFRIQSVTPIDQFVWTPHVEAIALLER